ncbi:MAG: hypothetical protein J6U49_05070 [Alistipes sp.]|jgi:hypothetical protein|nr:hypothetical protein [Alistipes sp.]
MFNDSIYGLIKGNETLLRELARNGVAVEDIHNLPIYEDYVRLTADGIKTTAVVAHLCEKYLKSDRTIWRIIQKMRTLPR